MSNDLLNKYRKPWDVTEEEAQFYTAPEPATDFQSLQNATTVDSDGFADPNGEPYAQPAVETTSHSVFSGGYELQYDNVSSSSSSSSSSHCGATTCMDQEQPETDARVEDSEKPVEEEAEAKVVELVVVVKNLSKQSLEKLPVELFDEHDITHLDLSYNMLSRIEPRISSLSNLRSINLAFNDLGSTPMLWFRFLESLYSLEELDLSNNKFSQVPGSVGDCPSLKKLNLSGNILSELPGVTIRNLRSLQVLDLSSNELVKLPDEITYLSCLKSLNLYDNHLQSFPQGLRFPASLEELDLSKNRLRQLHPILFGIATTTYFGDEWRFEQPNAERQLRVLRASQNHIDVIDEELFLDRFPNLEELLFSSNELTQLPQSIGFLTKLCVMDVSDNKLFAIPSCIRFCSHLVYLNLCNNHLSYLPFSIGRLSKLEFLSVSDNQLTELPYTICRLTKLKTLALQNNFLKTLPPLVADMEFDFISLEGNACPDIPPEIVEMGTPEILKYLKSNPSMELEGQFEFVGEINDDEEDTFFRVEEDIERDGGWLYRFETKHRAPSPKPTPPQSGWLSYLNPFSYFSKS